MKKRTYLASAAAVLVSAGVMAAGTLTFTPSSMVSGLAPSATTDTTNAANITSGNLDPNRLPIAAPRPIPAFASFSAAYASGLSLYAPKGVTTLYPTPPDQTTITYYDFVTAVQEFTAGGDAGNGAFNTHQVTLGNANRRTGSQSAFHIGAISRGSGANGEPNADFGGAFSIIKDNWSSYSANPGEADVITCNGRNGGPNTGPYAGQYDMNCLSGNIQDIKGGYLAGVEMVVSDIDPTNSFAIDHNVGIQTGVVNSREGDYEGYLAASNNGANTVAFHASGSINGSNFLLYNKITSPCSTAGGYALQDVFSQLSADGTMAWAPCPATSGGAAPPAISLGPDGNGALVTKNAAGAVVSSVDQAGNLKGPTFSPTGAPNANWTVNNAANPFPIAAGGTYTYPYGSGSLLLYDANTGNVCLFLAAPNAGITNLVSQAGTSCSATAASGKLSLTIVSGALTITNGGTSGDFVSVVGTRLN